MPDAEKHAASFKRRHAVTSNTRTRATDEPAVAFIVIVSELASKLGDEPPYQKQLALMAKCLSSLRRLNRNRADQDAANNRRFCIGSEAMYACMHAVDHPSPRARPAEPVRACGRACCYSRADTDTSSLVAALLAWIHPSAAWERGFGRARP